MKKLLVLSVLFIVVFCNTIIAQNWQIQNSNLPANVMVVDFSAVNNQVCWAVGQIYPQETAPYAGYIRTTDGGNNWVCDTIPSNTNGYFQQIFAIDADTAYATAYVLSGGNSKGIYKTTDGGTTWNRQNAFNTSLYGPGYIHFFDAQNGVVIGDPNLETYTTTNGGLTWNQVSMPPALTDELTWLSGNGIKAIDNTIWFGTGARLFKSTDRGYTWTIMVSEPQYIRWLPCIAFQDSQNGIYSLKKQGDASDHLYRKTTDGGFTWDTISNAILDNIAPTALQHIPGTEATYIVSGGRNPGMNGTAITDNAGETWSLIDNVGNLYIIFPSIYVGWGSLRETNVVQKYIGPPLPVELTSFTAEAQDQKIILKWTTATELNNNGFEIQRRVADSDFITVGFVRGEGTTTNQKEYFYIDKDLANGKYSYRLKQIDFNGTYEYSNVIEVEVRSLNDYSLEQNYPNPFNPTTTIGYVLKENTIAKIILLNAVGEEVAVLADEEQEKGFHKIDFNASTLASGFYFYQLKAGSFIQTKKMLLLK